MKKIEIHFFSERTGKSRTVRFSLMRLLWWSVGCVLAIGAYFWFSPLELWNHLMDGKIIELYGQNHELRRHVTKTRSASKTAEKELSEISLALDSALNQNAGELASKAKDRDSGSSSESFTATYATYRALRDSLAADSALASRIPVLHPLRNHDAVTRHFGLLRDHFTERTLPHFGVDFFAEEGDTVIAPGAGTVTEVAKERGFGLSLKIAHTGHVETFYAHLSRALVSKGAPVRRGEPIAIVGASGYTEGPGLHYEVHYDGAPVNPEDYFITQ